MFRDEASDLTAVEYVILLGGETIHDPRFSTTPVPVVAKVPNFHEHGFGINEESAAQDLLDKLNKE